MTESRNVVIVTGIPGVGKSTVVNTAVEQVKKNHGEDILILNIGSEMFEVATKAGHVKNRDELRKLPTYLQREIQRKAGESIAEKSKSNRTIVDTHTLIQTNNGYLIGLPEWVVNAIKPKTVVLIEADSEKIASRRTADESRTRDAQAVSDIQVHQEMCRGAAVSVGTITGATVRIIKNREGLVEEAAAELAETLME